MPWAKARAHRLRGQSGRRSSAAQGAAGANSSKLGFRDAGGLHSAGTEGSVLRCGGLQRPGLAHRGRLRIDRGRRVAHMLHALLLKLKMLLVLLLVLVLVLLVLKRCIHLLLKLELHILQRLGVRRWDGRHVGPDLPHSWLEHRHLPCLHVGW
jgi:hypothetical protein